MIEEPEVFSTRGEESAEPEANLVRGQQIEMIPTVDDPSSQEVIGPSVAHNGAPVKTDSGENSQRNKSDGGKTDRKPKGDFTKKEWQRYWNKPSRRNLPDNPFNKNNKNDSTTSPEEQIIIKIPKDANISLNLSTGTKNVDNETKNNDRHTKNNDNRTKSSDSRSVRHDSNVSSTRSNEWRRDNHSKRRDFSNFSNNNYSVNDRSPNQRKKTKYQYYAVVCKDYTNPLHGVRHCAWEELDQAQRNGEFYTTSSCHSRDLANKLFNENCRKYSVSTNQRYSRNSCSNNRT